MTDQLMCRFKEMEREVEELKQQLQAEEMSRKSAAEDQHHSEVERVSAQDKDLQRSLDDEKPKSVDSELHVHLH